MEKSNHWEEEKTIDREVVVSGATTDFVWYDAIIQSTPEFYNNGVVYWKMVLKEKSVRSNLEKLNRNNIEPQIDMYTDNSWDTYFIIWQKKFTNFPDANRYYQQAVIWLFKPKDLYWPDLANILLANQPWFQQYEKKEFSKISPTLRYKDLHIQHNQELLDLLQSNTPVVYHIATTNHGQPFANEWATFQPLQTLLATIAKLSIDRQRDILLSTQRPMRIPKSYEEIKTVIPGKPWYWQEKKIPAEGFLARFKQDKIDKKWIDPIPEKIETKNKVKSWSNDHDNIIIHYGSEDQRSESTKDSEINTYKNQGRKIYAAN